METKNTWQFRQATILNSQNKHSVFKIESLCKVLNTFLNIKQKSMIQCPHLKSGKKKKFSFKHEGIRKYYYVKWIKKIFNILSYF